MLVKVKIYTFGHHNLPSLIEKRKSYVLKIMFRSNVTAWIMSTSYSNSRWLDGVPLCQWWNDHSLRE